MVKGAIRLWLNFISTFWYMQIYIVMNMDYNLFYLVLESMQATRKWAITRRDSCIDF